MLNEDVRRYVELHRNVGFKYRKQENLLASFVRFAEARGDAHVIGATALAWATAAPSVAQRHNRLLVVRRFALQMQAEDQRHEVPPEQAFGKPTPRRLPHIYTVDEIARLVGSAATLKPADSIRPATYSTLLALMASTGLRICEVIALQLDDITPAGLIVRHTKFRKTRLVPLHETARRGLERYLERRARVAGTTSAVFISNHGTALCYGTVNRVFLELARTLGLRAGPGAQGPRIHDLRHTFAVRSLERCDGDRSAVARHMLALSTYLGHAHVADTYWYLHATPKLMEDIGLAGERLFTQGQS